MVCVWGGKHQEKELGRREVVMPLTRKGFGGVWHLGSRLSWREVKSGKPGETRFEAQGVNVGR